MPDSDMSPVAAINEKRQLPLETTGQNFGEKTAEMEKKYRDMVLNPDKESQEDNKKKRWIGDSFANLARDNLPMPPNHQRNRSKRKLNTV